MPSRFLLVFLALAAALAAKVVGTNPPPAPLTAARLAALPAAAQPAWRDYLARSERARALDGKFYADELRALGLTEPLVPPRGGALPRGQPPAWFAGEEPRRIVANLLTYQTPAGGWNKNTKFADHPRRPGERSGTEAGYVGTFDNDATSTPLRFIARVIGATPDLAAAAPLRAAFARGLAYIFSSQFPNGGWPQVWPLEGGYHDAITLNDGAMINTLALLREVAAGAAEFAFVPVADRASAAAAFARGVDCLLATQLVTAGRRTVWCQQHDPLTLAPVGARNYEMPSQASGESAGVVFFLMDLPDPSPEIVRAVHAAVAWFARTPLHDVEFKPTPDPATGRTLHPAPGAGPLWPRYAELGTDRPLFGDRDLTIHDDVNEISRERRNGYAWFNNHGARVLAHYAKWAQSHPAKDP